MDRYRVLRSELVRGLTERCSDCDRYFMPATGDLLFDGRMWFIVFSCPTHGAISPIYSDKYKELLHKITDGIDPSTLPEFIVGGASG